MFGSQPSAAPHAKAIWRSKTFWLNVVGGAVLILNGPLGARVPPELLGLVLAALNIVNRFLTSQPVTLVGRLE